MTIRSIATLAIGAGLLAGTVGCSERAPRLYYDPALVENSDAILYELDAVRTMEPQGPLFNRGLREGYLEYVGVMEKEFDFSDYYHFAFKSIDSAKGEEVFPDTLDSRTVPPESEVELAAGRARLMAALDQTGRRKAPFDAARAQTLFDCWLERTEDRARAELIEACKGAFEESLAEVERALATDLDNVYLVFFAWNQADVSPVAASVLEQVYADYMRGRPARVVVAGHADRSGPAGYNLVLSQRRAEAVADALSALGMPGEAMTLEAFGENSPRVPTADGVREPQNRRVEIVFG